MRTMCYFFLSVMLCTAALRAEYEGTSSFRGHGGVNLDWMVSLLPYNPIIVDAGSYTGKEALHAARAWPQCRMIAAFEPNPRAFEALQKAANEANFPKLQVYPYALNNYNGSALLYVSEGPSGDDPSYEKESSLLPPTPEMAPFHRGPILEVPCVILDDWCKENQVDHIDILRLDLEGAELQVLQSSPEILKTVKLLIVPSFFYQYRVGMPTYFPLKDFLTKAQFVPLAHWYTPGGRGMAVYISNELFDAYFVRCLGLGIGGMQYP